MELGLALLERFPGDVVLSPYSLARALDVVGRRPFAGAGECTMMSVTGEFSCAQDAVRLPYGHGDLRFVAMLGETFRREAQWRPGEGNFKALFESIEREQALRGNL